MLQNKIFLILLLLINIYIYKITLVDSIISKTNGFPLALSKILYACISISAILSCEIFATGKNSSFGAAYG